MAHSLRDGQTIESRFYFDSHPVRVVGSQEDPEWVATDVCAALGLKNVSKALANVPEDETGVTKGYTSSGTKTLLTLKEPGLYRLIFRSNKKEAEAFRRWVFHEVLPTIRKTGGYGQMGQAIQEAGELIQEMDGVLQQQAKAISRMASKAAAIMSLARWHRSPNPHQQSLPFKAQKSLGES